MREARRSLPTLVRRGGLIALATAVLLASGVVPTSMAQADPVGGGDPIIVTPTSEPTASPAPDPATPTPDATPTPTPSPTPVQTQIPVPVQEDPTELSVPPEGSAEQRAITEAIGDARIITVAGAPLEATFVNSPFTAVLTNSNDIVGDVTWLLDDAYYAKSTTAPHSKSITADVGPHKLKARWVVSGTTTEFVVAEFTVGPYIALNGVPLGGTNITTPMTVQLANASTVTGAVTWLLDDVYAGQDLTAPYEWTVAAPLGKHKLVARWVVTGTTTARTTTEFTVQTDLEWKPPAEIREEPEAALKGLWLTGDNRRAAIPGVYDWSKAGFGGGTVLPSDENVRAEPACSISAAQMVSTFGAVPNDGVDDTVAIQAAIDQIRTACSSTGEYTSMSRILLPAGTLNVSTEIHVDADYLIIRGAGSDPATGTHLAYLPNADTRYDTITADGTRWDIDAMGDGAANGGWIWPGRGLFRIQSRAVAPQYAAAYAAAPANRKDLYEGTINDHWTTGLTLRGKPGDTNYAGRKGDTVLYLNSASSFDNLKVGGLVNVMAANSTNFYDEMGALPTEHELDNLYMRQQIFMVTAGDPFGKTITLDKPLEYDVPVTSVSDGSAPINGTVTNSKLSPLVDAVVGVGIENLSMTQLEPGLDPARAKDNYGNMDPAGAMHGIVLKWAANSWVTGVKTEMTGSHPIVTEDASNLSIVDNDLDGAWNKGKGGNGYFRGSRVWDSVFAGNTMRNLRHFTFQWSSSGNVAIGNSSDADLNLHGGYERNNLFELNEISIPYNHRPDNCWTNCGGEGSSGVDDADWYPIWWAAGKKAVKWSGSSGPNNVFFNNYMRKQLVNGTTPYTNYDAYSDPDTIYQFGVTDAGAFHPLDSGGAPIADWAGSETVNFSGHGVVSSRKDAGQSLFLNAPTLDGYGGPNPQPLRRTWGCSCWDGRGMVNTRLAADPVNTATGSLMESFTDLSIAGVGDSLVWGRTYNSLDPTPGPLGQGWTFAYNASLTHPADGFYYYRDGTGSQSQYSGNGAGSYTANDPGVTAVLTDRVGGGWTLTNQVGGRMEFDAAGKLVLIRDERDFGATLAYSGTQLHTVTDTLGQTFTVTWSSTAATARISGVEGSDGLSVGYGYATLAGQTRLETVTGIDGKVTTYGYDAATGFVNSITDPEGNVSARTTYDPATGRAIAQLDANGGETTFAWDAATETATITDPEGNVHRDVYQGNVLVSQIDDTGRSNDVYYNTDNHPIAENNAAQQLTTNEYDAAGNLVRATAPTTEGTPSGLAETWTYDAQNRVTSHTDLLGGTTGYTYDAAGNKATETNAAGGTTSWTYNTLGLPLTETNPLNATTTMTYSPVGDLLTITQPGGETSSFTYDARHNRTSQTDPRGNVAGATAAEKEKYTSHSTYDVFGRLLTTTDALDHVTTNTYDDLGRLLTVTAPNGGVTTYSYDANGNVLTTTDEYGHTTTNVYDETGNVTSTTLPGGAKTTFTHNDSGQVMSTTDPIGNAAGASAAVKTAHTTLFEYDAAGNQTAARIPDPASAGGFLTTVTTYDVLGRPVAVTDPSGGTTRTTYDPNGNVLTTVDPSGTTQSATYDALNRETNRTAGGSTVTNVYDSASQLISSTTGGGAKTTYEYNSNGQLTKQVDPRGNVTGAVAAEYATTYAYDPAGNQVTSTDPLGRISRTYVNALDAVTKTTDPATRSVNYGYDSTGNVNKVTTATGAVTLYAYNKIGQLTKATNPLGGETTYGYTSSGQIETVTTPSGKVTNYEYDANGNQKKINLPEGSITRGFDAAGRLTTVDYSNTTPDVAMTYDRNGRATSVTNGTATADYKYDGAGKVTSIKRGNATFGYTYDATGRLTKRTMPDGRTQDYNWGTDSRLSSTTMTAVGITQTAGYTYDPAGQLASTTRSNGPTTTRTYDRAGQLTNQRTLQGTTTTVDQTVNWTAGGQPDRVTTTQSGSTRSVLYGYDDNGQITSVCSPTSGTTCGTTAPKTTFVYDLNGNRTSAIDTATGTTTSIYDTDDRLTSTQLGTAAATTYTYGPNGDLRTQASAAGTRAYTYGLDGNLYNATLEDGRSVNYTYDESGNRTARTVNGTTDAGWVWDTQSPQPVRVNETGTTAHRWFEDPQSSLGTATLEVSSAGVPTWLVSDFQGSITGTIKTAGLTGTAKYGAFGEDIAFTGSMTSQPLQFQGQYKDNLTGLYDMRLRDYNPATGGFTSTDPVAAKAGTAFASTYNFAYNQPTTLSDPSGACPWCALIGAVGGAVVGAAIGGIAAGVTGGNVWAGIGAGAVGGAIVGGLTGLAGPAGFSGGMAILAAMGIGAVANVGAGATYRWINGEKQSVGGSISDAGWGLIGGAGGFALGKIGQALSRTNAVQQALAAASGWLSRNTPAPLQAASRWLFECGKPSSPSAAVPDSTSAVNKLISAQRQARHLEGTSANAQNGGGYFRSIDDAQRVLDAYHSGRATVVRGESSNGNIVVKFDGVTGYNNNVGAGYINQPTNTFIIKGTKSVSIVPTSPGG